MFHKNMIGEIIGAICKKSQYRATESYFGEWCLSSDSWHDDKVQHTKNINTVEKKCRSYGDFSRGQMWEILCIPFGAKERNPDSIYREKQDKGGDKNKS